MEKAKDQKQIWRKYVNHQLKSKYKNLYSQLNCLIYLKAQNFSLLQKWRLKQERKLWFSSKKKWYDLKNKPDVIIFEGWCVGAKSEKNNTLKKTINSMEKAKDQKIRIILVKVNQKV